MSSEPFIGIDFGTCNSSVAWFNPRTGQAEILLNAEGEQKTPSVVYFGADGTVVGKHAEDRLESVQDRKRVFTAVKRELAKPRAWLIQDNRVTPIDVARIILRKLKCDAEQLHFHETVNKAVITHPAVFDEFEKDKLREAGQQAGFQEVILLEEPVAAAMAYVQAGMKVRRNVLVYDLGGGTFDLAFLVRDEDQEPFRLASSPKGDRIGGEDFDRAIYDHFDKKVKKQLGLEVSEEGVDLNLLRRCRGWKESLSISENPQPFSYWLYKAKKSLKYTLTRKTFEGLIDPLVQKTVLLAKEVQREASEAGHEPEDLLLIGGSSRVPLISSCLQAELKLEPRKWQMQDLAVALGAAYHGQRLWGRKTKPPVPAAKKSDRPKNNIAVALELDPATLVQPSSPPRNPILMAVCSALLPGLGQMVLGQVVKGVVMLLGGIAVALITAGAGTGFVLALSARDSYAIAVKLRDGKAVRKWEFF
jgi:molecular chaperone DnaK (HSP70)